MFSQIYDNVCNSNKGKKLLWESKEHNLHRHHIIPTHSGGLDIEDNYTYLTIREHILCHYMLWKINGNINDLRSMHMLGANLTRKQRQAIGFWCRDNKVGFFKDKEEVSKGGIKAYSNQKKQYEKDGTRNFYYWSISEGRKERSSLGGRASWEVQKKTRNGIPFCISLDQIERSKNASKGALAAPKKPVTDGTVTYKLFTEEDRIKFIGENPNFRIGCHKAPLTNNKDKVWLNKEGRNCMAHKSNVDKMISEGWNIGKIQKKKNKLKCLNKEGINIYVEIDKIDEYLSLGWMVGRKRIK